MQKTSGNVFLGHLEEQVFHFFPKVALNQCDRTTKSDSKTDKFILRQESI